jgi:hypothetical protein
LKNYTSALPAREVLMWYFIKVITKLCGARTTPDESNGPTGLELLQNCFPN